MIWPLDANDFAIWQASYNRARKSFVLGATSHIEALDALRNLRYRDEALKIEMREWERAKSNRKSRVTAQARKKLKDYINEPRSVASPSSI